MRRAGDGQALRPGLFPIFSGLMLLGVAIFVTLGVWQLERRVWKLDLIARVDGRVAAAPVPVPPPSAWPTLEPADVEYRHVRLRGRFGEGEALVKAVTALGPGWWVMAPFVTDDGFTVLVDRGFVPSEARDEAAARRPPSGDATVTGLLRLTEPGGAFLRSNDAAAGRWYSRDVGAIAAALGLGRVAPFFVDAEAAPDPRPGDPVGGLTVVAFRNSHLTYALTWFGLALGLLAATVVFIRHELRLRRAAPAAAFVGDGAGEGTGRWM
ncbi:SURF1 family protein [Mangrovibrevibacter kandeliae]|uniref:SURF1 family protein n=1 Tax=Mangrovibrevibacter kandeliae TaxID=2968473 RepID=UPI0035574D53